MTDAQTPATKEDVKMLLEVLSATVKQEALALEEKIDKRMNQVSEDLHTHMGVLTEDAEERFLKTGHDALSLQADKLKNHEARLTRVESAVGF